MLVLAHWEHCRKVLSPAAHANEQQVVHLNITLSALYGFWRRHRNGDNIRILPFRKVLNNIHPLLFWEIFHNIQVCWSKFPHHVRFSTCEAIQVAVEWC